MSRPNKARSTRLNLQSFDDRIVPAVVDLTAAGANGVANGAIFQQFDAPVRNNGVNTFLQLDGRGVEQGYNTDGKEQKFGGGNDFSGKSIKLSQIPLVTAADGTQYRAFNIDVREPSRNATVSLDELRIYTDSSRKLTGYDASTQTLGGKAAVYDMDGQGDTVVVFNADLNSKRSRGDAFVYIPNSAFAGVGNSDYVYLYSKLGVTNAATGGAEAWSIRNAPTPPTIDGGGGGASISGTVFFDRNADGTLDPTDPQLDAGLGGVTVRLVWTDGSGMHSMDAVTTADGLYSFTGLTAGISYSVYQVHIDYDSALPQVDGFNLTNAGNYAGNAGGTVADGYVAATGLGDDGIIGITLNAGQAATGYNFTMVQDFGG